MTPQPPADVCLVLEGTYPFVPGGVSSWVHHLISHLPQLQFSILHISPAAGSYDDYAYHLPPNVCSVDEIYLHQKVAWGARVRPRDARTFTNFLDSFRRGEIDRFPNLVHWLHRRGGRERLGGGLLLNPSTWNVLIETFEDEAGGESFLNYFWNWCYAHQPLMNVLAAEIPVARMYHTVSTGYAGVLAAAGGWCHKKPMILTEHGIYTKERRIEIHSAEWIQDRRDDDYAIRDQAPYFRRFWNRQFQMMSRICYERAAEIFTLYNGNTDAQIQDGADPDKLRIIPNGIDVQRFAAPAKEFAERKGERPFTVGFVGRVCPIKDVRTFIAAMRIVRAQVDDLVVRILGPMEEDKDYAEECQRFTTALGLDDCVRFEGRVAVDKELPSLDVLVLTSISEAQPLVILEGGAVGVPVVATDVGSCRELLEGGNSEDRTLGVGGLLTSIASPGQTADAILKLHADPSLRLEMGANLQARVHRFYDQGDMVEAYAKVYDNHLELEPSPAD